MPTPDLLVRTREGDNALQLALRSGALECVALLEGATQAAAAQGTQQGGDGEKGRKKEKTKRQRCSAMQGGSWAGV